MKNEICKIWNSQKQHLVSNLFLILIFTAITAGSMKVFADASHCANPLELSIGNQVKMRFCEIPANSAVMIGSENGGDDEKPVKARSFKKFHVAQFEVSRLQYRTVMGSEPWERRGYLQNDDHHPAVYMSYEEAQQFASALNSMDPTAIYRLPTEAEFEYAARAGTTTHYYWGDEMDANFAYFWGNTEITGPYDRAVNSCPMPTSVLSPFAPVSPMDVRRSGYCANGFGLYHILGNAWEWTEDIYKENYTNAPVDGHIAVKSDDERALSYSRVVRGGGWNSMASELRSAFRGVAGPEQRRHVALGFRLVRIPKSESSINK